jgi:hypothetical protein
LERIRKQKPRPAAAAAGAARDAALAIAEEPARVRRRVAEVAADRGASAVHDGQRKPRRRSRKPVPAPEPVVPDPNPKKGLIAALRSAAEALVGRLAPEPPPPPEPPKKRTRRGKRGGRGRGGKRTSAPQPQDVGRASG